MVLVSTTSDGVRANHRAVAGISAISTNCSAIKILREHGVAMRNQGLGDDDIAVAATLYRDGKTLAQHGQRFGISPMRSAIMGICGDGDDQRNGRPCWQTGYDSAGKGRGRPMLTPTRSSGLANPAVTSLLPQSVSKSLAVDIPGHRPPWRASRYMGRYRRIET
jgi:hypothetical protein